MIKSIRLRPLEKPLIIQQTIYNHKQVVSDYNSEASFLKLSENASKQISNSPDLDHFQAIENQIYTLQQKSALKLNQLQQSLARLESGKRNKVEVEKELMEENKENLCVAYQRVVQPKEDNDNMLQCKFQMDENFNYVKNKEYFQSQPFATSQVKGKEIISLQSSMQLTFKKTQSDQQATTKRKPRPRSFSLSCHPHEIDSNLTVRKSSVSKHPIQKKQKEHRSTSSGKEPKRGRVYQEILSLYSIPKLLAMELKVK